MGKGRVPLAYLASARLRGQHGIQLATRKRVQGLDDISVFALRLFRWSSS